MSIKLPTVCILLQPTGLSRSALDLRHSTIVASINFKTNSLLYGAFCFRNSPSARRGHWHFYEVLQMRVRLKVAILMQEACEERAREREREVWCKCIGEESAWYSLIPSLTRSDLFMPVLGETQSGSDWGGLNRLQVNWHFIPVLK